MKKQIFKIAVFSTALIFVNAAIAQDTVKVVKEQTVVHDTVVKKEKSPKPDLRRVELGVRYLPTFSSLDLRTYNGDIVKGSATMSNGFGIMLGLNLNKYIGVQGELNYYQVSQKYKDRNLDRQIDISYLNIPVLLSLNTNKESIVNLNLVAGPQFGINVGSNIKTSGNNNTDTLRAVVSMKHGDVGFAYGAGLEVALNPEHTFRLDLGFRGFYGLVNMNSTASGKDTYNVIVEASRKTYGGYIGLTLLF
ncbi:MAG: porin family protein [Bacteroidia bacterium]